MNFTPNNNAYLFKQKTVKTRVFNYSGAVVDNKTAKDLIQGSYTDCNCQEWI
jgi:hypothetical protein